MKAIMYVREYQTPLMENGKATGKIRVEERADFLNKENNKMLTESTYAIDLMEMKVIKNRSDADNQSVIDYYLEKYQDKIRQSVALAITDNIKRKKQS